MPTTRPHLTITALSTAFVLAASPALAAPPVDGGDAQEPASSEDTADSAPSTDWNGREEASFATPNLETYLDTTGSVIVVAAGAPSPALEAARSKIETQLDGSSKVSKVLDHTMAGDTSTADDEKIANRLTAYPVDRIVIVRAFPDDDSAIVVVSVVDKTGRVVSGFNVPIGTPVPANQGTASTPQENPGAGVSDDAASAVSSTVEQIEDESKSKIAEYNRKFLYLQNIYGVRVDTGQIVSSAIFVRQGLQRKPVDGGEFYEIIERPDLAKKYKVRRGLRLGLGIGLPLAGLGIALGGTPLLVQGLDRLSQPEFGAGPQPTPEHDRMVRDSIIMFSVGGGLMLTGVMVSALLRSHPVKGNELYDLVDTYNRKLLERLGLSEEDIAVKDLQVGMGMANNGGGISLSGRF